MRRTNLQICRPVLFLVVLIIFQQQCFAETKRHLVLYGKISNEDLPLIAKADILVVGDIPRHQLKRIRDFNPRILFLKYYHALGIYNQYPEWAIVNRKEELFAHDRNTGERLISKPYGWYLMDHTNQTCRSFLAQKIVKDTSDLFGGVFLDDFWAGFVDKFVGERLGRPGFPRSELIASWDRCMISFLKELRERFNKQIYINGAHERYMAHVDGCMAESFVHSNQRPDDFHHDPSHVLRSIRKIEKLKKYGKHILVQSGSRGDATGDTERLFRQCFACYLLIATEKTSFFFQPSKTYQFTRSALFKDYDLDLGEATGPYRLIKEENGHNNLLQNGNFETGLSSWKVTSGSPCVDPRLGHRGKSILFRGGPRGSDMIQSPFISVQANRPCMVSAWCRTEKNTPGSAGYKKLGLRGRFYDVHKKKLKGAYDLQFDAGSYDWQPFEREIISPTRAAYFRIRIGFVGDGTGKGWVDQIYFGDKKKRAVVFRRDFSRGLVLVNIGTNKTSLYLHDFGMEKSIAIKLKAKEGLLLQKKTLTNLTNK